MDTRRSFRTAGRKNRYWSAQQTIAAMDFVNLTPKRVLIRGDTTSEVAPSGVVAIAGGINVPNPIPDTIFIVLPAVARSLARTDIIAVDMAAAVRSARGSLVSHVAYWPPSAGDEKVDQSSALPTRARAE